MGSYAASLLAFWALTAAVFDWRQRRVPNGLLIVAAIPAVVSLLVWRRGVLGIDLWSSFIGFVIGVLPYLPGYVMGKAGAGDVKLSGLQGLLLGGAGAFKAFLVGAAALGCIALFVALSKPGGDHAARLPAAVALAVGFLWVILGDYLLPGWGL